MQKKFYAGSMMLLTAAIWGGALVMQRIGMDSIGPFLFSGLRFLLGALVLLPVLLYRRKKFVQQQRFCDRGLWRHGLLLGVLITAGINLQQFSLLYTSVSNVAFISGTYVVFVPLIGLLLGVRAGLGNWLAVALVLSGLYLLSVQDGLSVASGDLLQLAGSLFWALHVVMLGYSVRRHDALRLAFIQYVFCAVFSLGLALLLEPIGWAAVLQAAPALAYAGVLSVGVGFSLQAIAQRHVGASRAAIMLSMEGVFAALAAMLFLGELLSARGYLGGLLLVLAMLLAQLWPGDGKNVRSAD